jgi:hypothetical protein
MRYSRRWLWRTQSSGIKNPVRTSHETHYVCATEISLLKLCKNWGFQGCDYEECRFLGYKNLVCTSRETHYISATEPSHLMLCKIWSFHGGDYEECRFLGYKDLDRTSQETHYISVKSAASWCYVKIEVFTAVTMKNVVFWDIKTQFVPHRRHITSPLKAQPVNAM